ncbi:MAG: phosphoglycerate dehydrogenase [Acidobacteriota bacterium]|jgi:D-3-phosphoglycerate dehydrogenase
MNKILIADPLQAAGIDILRDAGADVTVLAEDDRSRLNEILGDHDALIVRSMTNVTREVLEAGRRLRVVGRAGIGVDNIDVAAATERGILVVNAPTANLLSATEHTFALLLALVRSIPAADASIKAGEWDRKRFVGAELQGKTLGVIGFGRIGQKVAERARGFGMEVIAHDPFLDPSVAGRLDVELLEIEHLLGRADVVTLHTPLTDSTRGMLSADRVRAIKPGAILVNCARGGLVDEAALLEALESGAIAGAALDVFDEEPPTDLTLVRHPRVVATPHIGAQTREAQKRIAVETAKMVLSALGGSLAVTAVNLPFGTTGSRGEPYLRLGETLGRLAAGLLSGSVEGLQVDLWGIDEPFRVPVAVAALKGVLEPALGEAINYVNAERVAEDRGIEVVRATHATPGDYPHLVGVTLRGAEGEVSLQGTLFGERDPRVVGIEGYQLEFRPGGTLLVLSNLDVPGVVGKVGSLLGEAGINIGDIHLARSASGPRNRALAVLGLDQAPGPEVVEGLLALDEVEWVRVVEAE